MGSLVDHGDKMRTAELSIYRGYISPMYCNEPATIGV